MTISKYWIASHTGMPSVYLTGTSAMLTAEDSYGIRNLGKLTNKMVSDPGAKPGVPTTYKHGSSKVTMTRILTHQWMLSDFTGRNLVRIGLLGEDDYTVDTRSYSFERNQSRDSLVRYALAPSSPRATLTFRTHGLSDGVLVRTLLDSRMPLWILQNPSMSDVPGGAEDVGIARLASIEGKYKSKRTEYVLAPNREWDVSVVFDLSPDIKPSPVVTWGEWIAWGNSQIAANKGWQYWSQIEIAKRVSGMPTV